jgi:poly(A) polymerase
MQIIFYINLIFLKKIKKDKIIDNFYKEKINSKTFSEKNLNKIFYYNGKEAVIDILNFKIFKSKKVDKKFIKRIN